MTRRHDIQCVHEPFGDAFYYGPERLSDRFEADEQARIDSGFSQSTFKTVLDRLEREASQVRLPFFLFFSFSLVLSPHLGSRNAPICLWVWDACRYTKICIFIYSIPCYLTTILTSHRASESSSKTLSTTSSLLMVNLPASPRLWGE